MDCRVKDVFHRPSSFNESKNGKSRNSCVTPDPCQGGMRGRLESGECRLFDSEYAGLVRGLQVVARATSCRAHRHVELMTEWGCPLTASAPSAIGGQQVIKQGAVPRPVRPCNVTQHSLFLSLLSSCYGAAERCSECRQLVEITREFV